MVEIDKIQVRCSGRVFEFREVTLRKILFEVAEGYIQLCTGEVLSSSTRNRYSFGSRFGAVAAGVERSIESLVVNGSIDMFVEFEIIEGDRNISPGSMSDDEVDAFQDVCTLKVYDLIWDDIFGNISEYYGFKWGEKVDLLNGGVLGERADA